MASAHQNITLELYLTGAINLSSDTIKVRLNRTSAHAFSQSDAFLSSLAAAIGADVTLGSKVLATTSADGGTFDAADAVFTAIAAGAAIDSLYIYKDTGVAGTSPILCYIDGFSVTPNGGDITIQWQGTNPFIFKI